MKTSTLTLIIALATLLMGCATPAPPVTIKTPSRWRVLTFFEVQSIAAAQTPQDIQTYACTCKACGYYFTTNTTTNRNAQIEVSQEAWRKCSEHIAIFHLFR